MRVDPTNLERRFPAPPDFVEGWRKSLRPRTIDATTTQDTSQQGGRIAIWIAPVDALLKARSCLQLLTDDDFAALKKIKAQTARDSATASRVLLRLALSRAVNRVIAPQSWRFRNTSHGRPIVGHELPPVHFSVSHSDLIAAVAVSEVFDIGVDVEMVDRMADDDFMKNFGAPNELSALRGLAPTQKSREFMKLWTLKEAYSKLIGLGLSADFSSLASSFDPVRLEDFAKRDPANWQAHFETLYITTRHVLHHVTLAIAMPAGGALSGEVEIISLAQSDHAEVAASTPSMHV